MLPSCDYSPSSCDHKPDAWQPVHTCNWLPGILQSCCWLPKKVSKEAGREGYKLLPKGPPLVSEMPTGGIEISALCGAEISSTTKDFSSPLSTGGNSFIGLQKQLNIFRISHPRGTNLCLLGCSS